MRRVLHDNGSVSGHRRKAVEPHDRDGARRLHQHPLLERLHRGAGLDDVRDHRPVVRLELLQRARVLQLEPPQPHLPPQVRQEKPPPRPPPAEPDGRELPPPQEDGSPARRPAGRGGHVGGGGGGGGGGGCGGGGKGRLLPCSDSFSGKRGRAERRDF